MASKQLMQFCKRCDKSTSHIGPGTSHLLHLVLSIITFGIWLPVWLLTDIFNSSELACSQCGKKRGFFG